MQANNDRVELFHLIKERERFFNLLQNGSSKDLEVIRNFLSKDPSRYIKKKILAKSIQKSENFIVDSSEVIQTQNDS